MDIAQRLILNNDVSDLKGYITTHGSATCRELVALRLRKVETFRNLVEKFSSIIENNPEIVWQKYGFLVALICCPERLESNLAAVDHIESLDWVEFHDGFGISGREVELDRLISRPKVIDGSRILSPRTICRIDRICLARPVARLKKIVADHVGRFIEAVSENTTDDDLVHIYLLACRHGLLSEKLKAISSRKFKDLAKIESVKVTPARLDLRQEKLKVAICVSGQLRGYKAAFESWKAHLLPNIDATLFFHVWEDVGRKEPTPEHLERVYSGSFLDAVRSVSVDMGWQRFIAEYRPLVKFSEGDKVSRDHLAEFYGCPKKNVVVEDDSWEQFRGFVNVRKMFYKIRSANNMASLGEFDLVVRIRPDKLVNSIVTVHDWQDIAHLAHTRGTIFAQYGYKYEPWGPVGGLVVDDQFAVSSPLMMEQYANAAYDYQSIVGLGIDEWPEIWGGHINLSSIGWLRNIEFESAPISLGGLVDPARLTANEIRRLLDISTAQRDRLDSDHILYAALGD